MDKSPVVTVIHDSEGDWQFLSEHGADTDKVMLVSLKQMLECDPTIAELSTLPVNHQAFRKNISDKWKTMTLKE